MYYTRQLGLTDLLEYSRIIAAYGEHGEVIGYACDNEEDYSPEAVEEAASAVVHKYLGKYGANHSIWHGELVSYYEMVGIAYALHHDYTVARSSQEFYRFVADYEIKAGRIYDLLTPSDIAEMYLQYCELFYE